MRIDGSSSSSSSSKPGVSGDGDDDDDEGPDDLGIPRLIGSEELGFKSGEAKEEREVESSPVRSGLMPCHCRVHIMHEGREVGTDEDEPGTDMGKHALSEASCSGLRHFAFLCGADKPEIDLFTSPDLCDCHLIGTEEEHRILVGTYRRICMPEVEFLMSHESVDHLTEDIEVAGV